MLGWEVFVFPEDDDSKDTARWMTGLGGLAWVDELVKKGQAEDLGGNGYPDRYSVTAGTLMSILKDGLPDNKSPLVIGDDYVHPKGWNGQLRIGNLLECPPDQILILEAWDQS